MIEAMYRKPAPAEPKVDPSCVIIPGEGLRGVWVGYSVASEVLAAFGSDGEISRHDDGDIFQLTFEDEDGEDEDAPRSASRPEQFHFEFGLLQSIDVGPYQRALRTDVGLRIGSTRADVIEIMGEPDDRLLYRGTLPDRRGDIETLRYLRRGIQFGIHHDGLVASMRIFHTRRRVG